jgi:hypothetical protein
VLIQLALQEGRELHRGGEQSAEGVDLLQLGRVKRAVKASDLSRGFGMNGWHFFLFVALIEFDTCARKKGELNTNFLSFFSLERGEKNRRRALGVQKHSSTYA